MLSQDCVTGNGRVYCLLSGEIKLLSSELLDGLIIAQNTIKSNNKLSNSLDKKEVSILSIFDKIRSLAKEKDITLNSICRAIGKSTSYSALVTSGAGVGVNPFDNTFQRPRQRL